jgi:putative SOS response-associated peptidase YedK
MCGRFTLTVDAESIQMHFPWLKVPDNIAPRYNIAPSHPIAVIPNTSEKKLDYFIWGLIPSWAKDPKIGNRLINARGETLAEKPSFRSAYKRRRCLIIADGFYEWVKQPGQKTKSPFYVQMESKEPFAFAGLWETWFSHDGSELKTTTIITTEPNDLISRIHARMPVILPSQAYDLWLDPSEKSHEELGHLLKSYPSEEMIQYPVSRVVNSPANDSPECVEPLQ